jgi:cellulose synthase (UDP-forming)
MLYLRSNDFKKIGPSACLQNVVGNFRKKLKIMINQNTRLFFFRIFAIIFFIYGLNYLFWRYNNSLNPDALIFAYILFLAETFMFFGSVLMIINHWDIKKIKLRKTPFSLSQVDDIEKEHDRPIKIDILIATFNEPALIVEQTIANAVRLKSFSKKVELNICLCDDGRRDGSDLQKEDFKKLAQKYNVNYFSRPNNKGYKAGNLNHVFWQTNGDFIIILDADTIVYANFINNLLPYFKDRKMAWVQSPQYFYDLPKGKSISKQFNFFKKFRIGKNIFGTDPSIFYQVILYHRNASNAAFCCGAGSIHRRKALESLIKDNQLDLLALDSVIDLENENIINKDLLQYTEGNIIGPFVHHISEDIYTSILMHGNANNWKSYQHPNPECKMLSPQTLAAYDKQFSRYAEGTFSIFFSRNNPIIKKGLSIWQRIAYGETMYSYFSAFWIIVFLLSPIIFYFTLIPPLKSFSFDFFIRFIILNILSQLLTLFAYWGISTNRSDQYFIAGFWLKIRAFFKVLLGKEIKFNTTSKVKETTKFNDNLKLIAPHLVIISLTIIGFIYNLFLVYSNQHPSISAFVANNIWAAYNIYQLSPIIRASFIKD